MITAVLQYNPTDDKAANLDTIEALLRDAAKRGVRLAVLPEYAIYTVPAMDQRFVDSAEDLDGPAVTRLRELSAELGLALVAGINEAATVDRIHNTLVGIDAGEIRAVYRKVHLYDAFGYRESDRVIAAEPGNGDTFDVDGFTVGMQTCYDLRFPEVSRMLVDAGATIIALPAEWVPGPLKEYHWNTLIRARAIENTVYVLAADQCAPTGAGNSAIIDPMGIALAQVGEIVGLGIADVSQERLDAVRTTNPALAVLSGEVG
ncbi:carbon-nitrogen hydrolase family protein [Flaviflexus salsibiostraticola]|uniref:Carbon-nitrogen hydrolase family protein n=1 Tax=Flaviflexus salsibiostraticola TaxID=1282737 RepID=A0A3Q8WTE2_9ACTO|nr:carbon-nitrogen hydrolase family protein [Flaviflexus salsibiostraticola]AZN28892.1 carbon-nitrogen hydrolase family protein [Flaviflexus salsibiostraticola]